MGIMIFMLKSQRRAFRWPNNFRARLYIIHYTVGMPDFAKPIKRLLKKDLMKNMIKKERTTVLNTCVTGGSVGNQGGSYVPQLKRLTFRIHPTDPKSFHVRCII